MENAAKALLMAASMLIGLLILTLAIYLFTSFGGTIREKREENRQQQITHFNSQFTSYQGKQCTIYDIITLANLATENNKYYEYPTGTSNPDGRENYISIKLGSNRMEWGIDKSNSDIINYNNTYIQQDINNLSSSEKELKKYKISSILISKYTSKVYQVNFVDY